MNFREIVHQCIGNIWTHLKACINRKWVNPTPNILVDMDETKLSFFEMEI